MESLNNTKIQRLFTSLQGGAKSRSLSLVYSVLWPLAHSFPSLLSICNLSTPYSTKCFYSLVLFFYLFSLCTSTPLGENGKKAQIHQRALLKSRDALPQSTSFLEQSNCLPEGSPCIPPARMSFACSDRHGGAETRMGQPMQGLL